MKKLKAKIENGLDKNKIIGQDVYMEQKPEAKISDYNPETGEIEVEVDDETFKIISEKLYDYAYTASIVSSRKCNCDNCKCGKNNIKL